MGWVSVEDDMPKHDECVDAFCNGPQDYEGRLTNIFYDSKKESWWTHDFKYDVKKYLGVNITHWMPLPDPPRKKEPKKTCETCKHADIAKAVCNLSIATKQDKGGFFCMREGREDWELLE